MDGKGLMFSKKLFFTLLLVFLCAAACSQTVPGTGTPAGTQSSSTNTGIPADTQSPSTVPIARTETENPAPQAIPQRKHKARQLKRQAQQHSLVRLPLNRNQIVRIAPLSLQT